LATPIEEAHWVLRAQCHDRDALELLLKSVQPVLRRYVTGLVGADDADDILQDVAMEAAADHNGRRDGVCRRLLGPRLLSRVAHDADGAQRD
jgi:DNA-directed RNA polymerase specialized sigma24 family protein